MIVYILRHAEAVEANADLPDEWRYLTEKGIKSTASVCKGIARHGRKPRLIISSPLVRAVQTAQIAAAYACRKNEVMVNGLLKGDGGHAELLDFILSRDDAKRIMIVGHEPDLGEFVAHLMHKKGEALQLKKAACVALELDSDAPEKPAKFLWYLEPGEKPVSSFNKAFSLN